MTAARCKSCGADVAGAVCAACGARVDPAAPDAAAVAELHRLVSSGPREGAARLLREGFLPDDTAALVEDGARTLPLVGGDDTHEELDLAALRRLDAVATKLRIRGAGPEGLEALGRFDRVLEARRRAERAEGRPLRLLALVLAGLVVLALLAAAIARA